MGILLDCSLFDTITVSLWHIAGILLPGMALTALLSRKHGLYSIIGWLTISFALGYCTNILLYFLFVPFQLQMLIPYGGDIMCMRSLCAGKKCIQISGSKNREIGSDRIGLFDWVPWDQLSVLQRI